MSAEEIISNLKNKVFKPVYWLEGEEAFFIDQVINFAEHHILSDGEVGFNLTIFYGKDADWAEVINACKRYPMFAERQVVLLKEAQQMKDIEKLASYIEHPLASTLFFVSYKEKKVDGKTKFSKIIKGAQCEYLLTKKMYDNQLPDWADKTIKSKGLSINPKALALLVDHIGNDLSRMLNEIEKLAVNLNGRKNISEEDIEKYIGISKEFNVFEFQNAFAKKDFTKAIRINQYFAANPKAAPIQLVLPSLYNFFSKVYMLFGAGTNDERELASILGVGPYFVKDYTQAARSYGQKGVEVILLLLHQYNLKGIGVNNPGTTDASLVKELIIKAMS